MVNAKSNSSLLGPAIATLIVVNILFFLDEGYYDFRWMKEPGNWLAFILYLVIVFPVQWLIARFLSRGVSGWAKVVLDVVLGTGIVLGAIFLL